MPADADEPEIRVGTSGWNYRHWRGVFYPEDLSQKQWFSHYATRFDTVEVNNTFYQLPEASTFEAWHEQAPARFVYTLKGNRYITHLKRLKVSQETVNRFLDRARVLKEHLGPILWQLPPRWHKNLQRLDRFLGLLPEDLIHVFEFRDEEWFADDVLELLDREGASFCTHDMVGLSVPRAATGRVAYVRFHGASDQKYRGTYGDEQLREWAEWLADRHGEGMGVYAYFNNDVEGHAPHDAARLREMLGGLAG